MNDPGPCDPTFGTLILAGGRSSRMGVDKASLAYRGQTLLQHMEGLARSLGTGPVLVGGGPRGDLADPVRAAGPVASLCALAEAVTAAPLRWLVVPVDMPLLTPALLLRLALADPKCAFFDGHPLPLVLTLDSPTRAVLERARAALAKGESVSVRHILAQAGAMSLTPRAPEQEHLVNANTPEEWDKISRGA